MTADALIRVQPTSVHCRALVASDLADVVALLVEGFPGRPAHQWQRGFARNLEGGITADLPMGYVLVAGDTIVGVLLTLYTIRRESGTDRLLCNLSSWYVKPDFRFYAALLESVATRRKDVTYMNISAVRRTWPMHEARGYRRFSAGQFVAAPLLSRPRRGVRVRAFDAATVPHDLSRDEGRLLADHARFGCVALVATDAEGSEPLVFIRRPAASIRQRLGWSPFSYFQLVYARPSLAWPRFAHALGRHLLRRHAMPLIAIDALGPRPDLHGRFIPQWGTKFARGPASLTHADLSYTELVVFGD